MSRGGFRARTPEACLASLVAAILSMGCTVQMYTGPKLPRDETARITADRASLTSIDGTPVTIGSAFMVRAGGHVVSATGTDANGESIGLKTLCLVAEGGANYQLRLGGIARRVPEIYDLDRGSLVGTTLVHLGHGCPAPPPRPRAVVAASPGEVAAPPEATGGDGGPQPDGAGSATDGETPPTTPPARAASDAPGPPLERATRATDAETPRQIRPERTVDTIDPEWVRHPGNGFALNFGVFLGGTDLVSAMYANGNTNTLGGGSGLYAAIDVMVTPLWAGDTAGFGLDAFAGLKYASVAVDNSGGSVSLMRYPLGLGAHVFLHAERHWWFLLRSGILKETGINLSGSVSGTGDLTGSRGWFGEGGLYYVLRASEGHTALALTFRYSLSSDSNSGGSFSANSGGVVFAIHFNLL